MVAQVIWKQMVAQVIWRKLSDASALSMRLVVLAEEGGGCLA